MTITANLIHHEIAANNILVGASTFLTLALPPLWNITIGAGRPEITASHERQGRRWVISGDAWYILHNPAQRWAMEVRLTAKPSSRSLSPSGMTVGGHPACVTWKRRKRGFIKRWPVTYVNVEFYCPQTDRQLSLEFSGRVPDEVFQEVVEANRYARCH